MVRFRQATGPALWPVFFISALLLSGTARGAGAAGVGLGRSDFYWRLSLERRQGAGKEREAPAGRVAFLFGRPETGGLMLRLGTRRAAFLRVDAGKETELAACRLACMPHSVTLVRRGRRHYLLGNRKLLLRANWSGAHTGRPDIRVAGRGIVVREVTRQRVAPLLFTDGFSREAGKRGPWKVARGNWESAVSSYARYAANPGAVRARFSLKPAVDPFEPGRLYGARQGLGVNLAPLEGGGMAITRVTGSSPAEKAGLRVGDVILSLRGKPLAGTRMLLLQASHGARMSIFRSGALALKEITVMPEAFEWGHSRRAVGLPGAAAGREALLTAGHEFWGLYRAECSVRTCGGSAVGLALALSGSGEGLLFRIRPEKNSWKAELLELGVGGEPADKALAAKDIGAPWAGSWYRLAADVHDSEDGRGLVVDCWLGAMKVFSVRADSAGFGRIGLWASGRGGYAEFDDVIVAHDRKELHRRSGRACVFPEVAAGDPFMATWSKGTRDWLAPATSGGAAELRYPCYSGSVLRLDKLPAREPLRIAWSDFSGKQACSVRLDAAAAGVEVLRGAKVIKRSRLSARRPLRVRCADGRISIRAGDAAPVSVEVDAGQLPRVAVRPAVFALSGSVAVRPADGLDLRFDRAPTELVASTGSWGLANRWVCDPRWSWFGGRADPLCAAWTARRFEGDQRLGIDAALLMTRLHAPHEIPRDIGLSICGNGRSLWSGYTLVFGADNNRCTRLYRRGVPVAETRRQAARFPDDFFSNPSRSAFHQNWYRLALEKRAGLLIFSVNNEVQLQWRDPRPLPGGRMAVWKMRGGLLLACLRADATEVGPLLPDLRDAPPPAAGAPLVAAQPSSSGPEISSAGEGLWRVRSLDGSPPRVRFRDLALDPAVGAAIRFRLRVPAGGGVDLFLEGGGERYRVGLTGPRPPTGGGELETNWLGRVEGVRADGRWQEVLFRPGPFWRDYWRRRYLKKDRAGGKKLRVSLGCFGVQGYRCTGLKAGAGDMWFEVSTPELVGAAPDLEPPVIGRPRLEGNTAMRRARVVMPLSDPGGSGLDARKLIVIVGGRVLRVGSPGLDYSERSGRLAVDPGAIRAPREAAGKYRIVLRKIFDRAGNRLPDQQFEIDVAAGSDKRPPEAVAVSLHEEGAVRGRGRPLVLGLERSRATRTAGNFFLRHRFAEGPCDHDVCEIVGATDGSALCAYVTPPASVFDLGRFPELDMGCRFGPTSPLAMVMRAKRSWAVAAINEDPVQNRGQRAWVPKARLSADRTWQRLTLPLARIYSGVNPTLKSRPRVSSLRFGDTGDRRSRRGTHLGFGDLRLVPVANPENLVLSWSAWDAGGVKDYRSALDNRPGTVPAAKKLFSGKPVPPPVAAGLKEGNAWLHLSFVDRSGNWSRSRHYRIIVDRSPPEIVRRDPGGRTGARCDGLDIYVADPGGVDPGSVVLTVDGQAYRLSRSRALSFNAAEGRLRWDARLALGRTLRAGQELEAALACADYAGNAMKPAVFSLRVDPSVDKVPPSVSRVRFTAVGPRRRPPVGVGRRALAWWRLSPVSGAIVTRAVAPEVTRRITRTASRQPLVISIEPRPWRLDHFPCLQFECRSTRGMRLQLVAGVSGREVVVPFSGLPGAPVVADGSWRRAAIDLGAIARRKLGDVPLHCAWSLVLREPSGIRNPAGSLLELRNVELWTGSTVGTRFILEGSDADSGLDGFAVVLDRTETTVPASKVNLPVTVAKTPAVWKPGKLAAGVWWLHVRAADLAGNWSGTTHFRLCVPERAPKGPLPVPAPVPGTGASSAK